MKKDFEISYVYNELLDLKNRLKGKISEVDEELLNVVLHTLKFAENIQEIIEKHFGGNEND